MMLVLRWQKRKEMLTKRRSVVHFPSTRSLKFSFATCEDLTGGFHNCSDYLEFCIQDIDKLNGDFVLKGKEETF